LSSAKCEETGSDVEQIGEETESDVEQIDEVLFKEYAGLPEYRFNGNTGKCPSNVFLPAKLQNTLKQKV